jgi:urea carboxylase
MKVETALRAPIDGVVIDVLVSPGDQVPGGSAVVVIGPAHERSAA